MGTGTVVKKKTARNVLIAAILTAFGALCAWLGTYLDNDASTVPDTSAVVNAVQDVSGAYTDYKTADSAEKATEATETPTMDTK